MTEERAKKYRLNDEEAEKSSLGQLWCGPDRHTLHPGGPSYRNRNHSLTRMGRTPSADIHSPGWAGMSPTLKPAGRHRSIPGGPTSPQSGRPIPAPRLPPPGFLVARMKPTSAAYSPRSTWAKTRPESPGPRPSLERSQLPAPAIQRRPGRCLTSSVRQVRGSPDRPSARMDQVPGSTK